MLISAISGKKNHCHMNKHFLKSLCLLALLPFSALFAQEESHNNMRLAFEFGTNAPGCILNKPELIRQSHNSKDRFSLYTSYFGVKPEFFVFRNRLGIAPGVRFVSASSKIVSGKEKILWRVKEEVDGWGNTEYVQIEDIRQQSYLFGIPLEIRCFLNNKDLPVQTYFKIGASVNYRIHSKNADVNFTNTMMEKYKNDVQGQIPNSNTFSSFFYSAIGFKIGKFREGSRVTWVNFEFQFPYIMLTENSFAFVERKEKNKRISGVGFQLSFDFPMGKIVPIGSN